MNNANEISLASEQTPPSVIEIMGNYLKLNEVAEICEILQKIEDNFIKKLPIEFADPSNSLKQIYPKLKKIYDDINQIYPLEDKDFVPIQRLRVLWKYFLDVNHFKLAYDICQSAFESIPQDRTKEIKIFYDLTCYELAKEFQLKLLITAKKLYADQPTLENKNLQEKMLKRYNLFLEYEAEDKAAKQIIANLRENFQKCTISHKSSLPFKLHSKIQFNAKEAEEFLNNRWQQIEQEQKENPQTINIASP